MNDLKCPICGSSPAKIERFVRWVISCPVCGFKTFGYKMDEALTEWNKARTAKYGEAEEFMNLFRQWTGSNQRG